MADIFISYASEDRSRVGPLAKALENQGWSVWWDQEIPPGMTFTGVIKKEIEEAKCVIVLWSKQSVRSEWVQEEATIGKRRKILVPAKIDPIEPPLGFGLIQAADLTDWNEGAIHPDFENLVNAIEKIAKPSKKETISVQGGAKIEICAESQVGYVLNENQDRMTAAEVPLGHLYIVADGGGNTKGGALAAELTVKGLNEYIGKASKNASADKVILRAFKKVNKGIYQKAHSGDDATQDMMSTAVVLLISGKVARVAHIGDSRAYLFRNGQLKRLTRDHTKVQKMVEAKMLTPEEAAEHPNANMVDRGIGNELSVDVEISDELPLQKGDGILLCSDGLWHQLNDAEIKKILRSEPFVQDIAGRLVSSTLKKGGKYNVTVQFIQYGKRQRATTCESGHRLDPNWSYCPYCLAEQKAKQKDDK